MSFGEFFYYTESSLSKYTTAGVSDITVRHHYNGIGYDDLFSNCTEQFNVFHFLQRTLKRAECKTSQIQHQRNKQLQFTVH